MIRYKVLVIDDDAVHLTVVRAWLESEGHEVLTHNGALGARAILLREEPEIVVLDLMMPGLTGDALARLLATASRGREPRMILYTGHDAKRLDALPKDLPILGTIAKTADGAAFLVRFRALLAAAEASHPPPPGSRRSRAW